MFDVGDLPVLTFGNCVLKTGVIEWPLKRYVRFLRFFSKSQKNMSVYVFELLHTFSRALTRNRHFFNHAGTFNVKKCIGLRTAGPIRTLVASVLPMVNHI